MFKRNGSGWGWKGFVCWVYGEMESHVTKSSTFKLLTKSHLWSKYCFGIENENKFNFEIILFNNFIETQKQFNTYTHKDTSGPWPSVTCFYSIYSTDDAEYYKCEIYDWDYGMFNT